MNGRYVLLKTTHIYFLTCPLKIQETTTKPVAKRIASAWLVALKYYFSLKGNQAGLLEEMAGAGNEQDETRPFYHAR